MMACNPYCPKIRYPPALLHNKLTLSPTLPACLGAFRTLPLPHPRPWTTNWPVDNKIFGGPPATSDNSSTAMTTKLPWPYLTRPRYEVRRPETSFGEFEVPRPSQSENLLPKNEKPFCRGWIIRMMMNSSEKRLSKRWGAGRGRFLGFGLVSFIHLTVIAGLSLGLVWSGQVGLGWSGLGFLNTPV